jgi:hypothetical protein
MLIHHVDLGNITNVSEIPAASSLSFRLTHYTLTLEETAHTSEPTTTLLKSIEK